MVFFRRVFPYSARLWVSTTIKLDGQATFEAVEIDDPVPDAASAAKFRAELSTARQIPSCLLGFCLAASQFADTGGWDAPGRSITALRRLSRALQLCLATEVTPHPARDGW
jgi:hypothetical protein